MDKRELALKRDYTAERLPEITLERQRLQQQSQRLKAEKGTAPPERRGMIARREKYIRIRIAQLRKEHAAVSEERKAAMAGLEALRTAYQS